MDLLTHLFLPITVVYVLRPDLFPSPWYLIFSVFAVIPDIDKPLHLQGAFHSAITLGIIAGALIILERWQRDDLTYALLITALLFSHLLLDILDGGPVTLLYPLSDMGIGFHYPTKLIVGGTIGTTGIQDPFPTVSVNSINRSRTTYSVITGYGVLSAVTFLTIYLTEEYVR